MDLLTKPKPDYNKNRRLISIQLGMLDELKRVKAKEGLKTYSDVIRWLMCKSGEAMSDSHSLTPPPIQLTVKPQTPENSLSPGTPTSLSLGNEKPLGALLDLGQDVKLDKVKETLEELAKEYPQHKKASEFVNDPEIKKRLNIV